MLKFRSVVAAIGVQARDFFRPALDRNPLPDVPPDRARGTVVSFYMPNISRDVVAAQRRVLKRFTPADVAIQQVRTTRRHEDAINDFMDSSPYRAVLILDIDCIPIREGAIAAVFEKVEQEHLVGAAQRANHIDNGGHIYTAPYCLGLSQMTYTRLGRPRFDSTKRGDVAEELTYAAERIGVPIDFLWPTSSEDHVWRLTKDRTYGHGTIYEHSFWHAFEIRLQKHQRKFVQHCNEVLAQSPRASTDVA